MCEHGFAAFLLQLISVLVILAELPATDLSMAVRALEHEALLP